MMNFVNEYPARGKYFENDQLIFGSEKIGVKKEFLMSK
jgi:hypothetical protein